MNQDNHNNTNPGNPTVDSNVGFPGRIRLVLPTVIEAVPGIEANVYFDNIVLVCNPANYAFTVTCDKGTPQEERWTFVPKPEEIGEYPLAIEARDEFNTVIARGHSTVRVVPAGGGEETAQTLLCIGDSLTHAAVFTQHLLDLCVSSGNPRLTLIGTHHRAGTAADNRHEGYGGWTAQRFTSHYNGFPRTGDHGSIGSPFLYPDESGTPHLDFVRYCREVNEGKGPDFVTILLGANDIALTPEVDIESRIDWMLGHYDTLVQMIRSACGDTRIGVVLPISPAASQDAFGASYGCTPHLNRWIYKRKQHRLVERMMQHYGGRERENIFIIPAYINLDCRHNYPQQTSPWNARTGQMGTRLNNNHPASEGYRQIGDTIYCWMKAMLASGHSVRK